eukprot:scaffold5032_cov17-Tisochrysis_lutea.AAC.1
MFDAVSRTQKPPALPDGDQGTGLVLKVPEAMEMMRPLCLASSKDLMEFNNSKCSLQWGGAKVDYYAKGLP